MKKLFALALAALTSVAFGATTVPVQLISPAGSSSGQAIVSTGSTAAPNWASIVNSVIAGSGISVSGATGNVTVAVATNGLALTQLAKQGANTVLANATAATANVTAFTMPSCSGATSALGWTSGTGFTCNSGVNAATLGGTTFAAPGPVGSTTASTGAFTTLSASSTVSGTGFSTYLASPPSIGGTAAAAGAFTTLNASGNDALLYGNTAGQSIANGTATTVTGWTKIYDRVNTNMNASTGVFTAPATAYYLVAVQIAFAAAATGAGVQYSVTILNNGSVAANGQYFAETATSLGRVVRATAVLAMTAGQTITIQAYQASGGAVALSTTASVNTLSITRLP